ncbi:MFS transporter [Rhodococcus sp. KBS0724]|uniref:MFS transporter n=1 Tax=Rhodococcus sp. KBS0724 TaxID=1179674 RepID=UPI00163DCE6B|nr:MFS transporter [Rhodococcus sp. KBS0724]
MTQDSHTNPAFGVYSVHKLTSESPGNSRASNRESVPPAARRAAIAGFVGTFIEYYDYILFGVLAVYLGPLFFPSDNPAVSMLITLSVFGAGFIARPLGGVIFGRLGDRRGRRTALLATVALMGLCSGLMGFLPTYSSIGVTASVILVILRLLQGLSAGAEMLGSVTLVLESSPTSRRTLLASLTPLGAGFGGGVALLMAAVVSLTVSKEAMLDYGWRIPFLASIPLTIIAFILRRRVEDSPEFVKLAADDRVSKSPIREAFLGNKRRMLVACGIAIGINGVAGVNAWLGPYLISSRELPASQIMLVLAISMLIIQPVAFIGGWLGDTYGRRIMITLPLIAFVVLCIPILWILGATDAPIGLMGAVLVYLALLSLMNPAAYTYMASIFPTEVRFTASNFCQNVGTVLAGGTAPAAVAALVLATGTRYAAAYWILSSCLIALLALWLGRGLKDPDSSLKASPGIMPSVEKAKEL